MIREFFLKWICPWWGLRVVARNYALLELQSDALVEDVVRTATKVAQKWRAAEKEAAQAKSRCAYLERVIADSHEVKRAKKAEKK